MCFVIFESLNYNNIDWSVSWSQVLDLIIFNKPFIIASQYWFLFALTYVYLLFALVVKFRLQQSAYYFAICMFVSYILLAQGLHLLGIWIPNMIYKNFLVEGFAFFMLGHWIHKNQSTLQIIRNNTLLILISVTTILCLVERFFVGRDFGVNIVTIPQVICLFLYAINNPQKHKGTIQEIGKRYSMYVYILHPFVWHSVEHIYQDYGYIGNVYAMYSMPIIVVVMSLIFSHIVYLMRLKISMLNFKYKWN